jgi:hypothetical protein
MRQADYSPRAATITDELIRLSEGSLAPEDRDPVRTVIRIAFEMQALLTSKPDDLKAREWTQETVCAGCESSLRARDAWRELGQFDGLSLPGAGLDTFPMDMSDLREQLNIALRAVEDGAAPLGARLRAVNRCARLQLLFLGATLW